MNMKRIIQWPARPQVRYDMHLRIHYLTRGTIRNMSLLTTLASSLLLASACTADYDKPSHDVQNAELLSVAHLNTHIGSDSAEEEHKTIILDGRYIHHEQDLAPASIAPIVNAAIGQAVTHWAMEHPESGVYSTAQGSFTRPGTDQVAIAYWAFEEETHISGVAIVDGESLELNFTQLGRLSAMSQVVAMPGLINDSLDAIGLWAGHGGGGSLEMMLNIATAGGGVLTELGTLYGAFSAACWVGDGVYGREKVVGSQVIWSDEQGRVMTARYVRTCLEGEEPRTLGYGNQLGRWSLDSPARELWEFIFRTGSLVSLSGETLGPEGTFFTRFGELFDVWLEVDRQGRVAYTLVPGADLNRIARMQGRPPPSSNRYSGTLDPRQMHNPHIIDLHSQSGDILDGVRFEYDWRNDVWIMQEPGDPAQRFHRTDRRR